MGQTRAAQRSRETPVLYLADDFEAERPQLAATVRSRLMQGERVGILLPQKRIVYGFADGMCEFGLEVEVCAPEDRTSMTVR